MSIGHLEGEGAVHRETRRYLLMGLEEGTPNPVMDGTARLVRVDAQGRLRVIDETTPPAFPANFEIKGGSSADLADVTGAKELKVLPTNGQQVKVLGPSGNLADVDASGNLKVIDAGGGGGTGAIQLSYAQAAVTNLSFVDIIAAPGVGKFIRIYGIDVANRSGVAEGVNFQFKTSAPFFETQLVKNESHFWGLSPNYIQGGDNEKLKAKSISSINPVQVTVFYTIV